MNSILSLTIIEAKPPPPPFYPVINRPPSAPPPLRRLSQRRNCHDWPNKPQFPTKLGLSNTLTWSISMKY